MPNIVKKFFILFLFFSINSVPASREEIRNNISAILSSMPRSSSAGILIYNPLTQDTVFQYNPSQVMIPASNNKLFTTAVALSMLGGNFNLSTKILSPDLNIQDGVINGNLYIKGYGNSVFTVSDLNELVSELKTKGIRKITGQIIGDDSYFDDVYYRTDWIPDEISNVRLAPVSALVIDRNRLISYKKVKRRLRSVSSDVTNPPLYAATLLKEKLHNAGIESGSAAVGIAPVNCIALCESKIALKDLIALINKHSDNYLAECLFKTIGAEASKKQGNSFVSTQAIMSFMEDNGIYVKGTSVVDGSGISRFDQVTPGTIVGILEKMYFDIPNFEDFYNSLSIAGVDGTLRHRFIGTSAENNLRGKTGTLNGVSSLSGYVTTAGGEDLIVSMIFQFQSSSPGIHKTIQNDIITTLSDWKREK